MNLTGQSVAVLGAGRSGRAAARLALHLGGTVTVYDTAGEKAFEGMPEGVTRHPGATVETGKACRADLVVISPGITTGGEFASAFATGAGEFIGEIEFAARVYTGTVVGITGTNGKTTTTELVERIMKAAGRTCEACGNYGRPFADAVLGENVPETVAVELSSFQLETIRDFRPDVAVWLNFSPDHMDRYTSVEDYRAAKLRIFENQRPKDVAVVRLGEDLSGVKGQCRTFSATEEGGDYSLRGSTIMLEGAEVLELGSTMLRGLHNAENAMAALATARALGISAEVVAEALADYAPPLHRCELVRTLDGVEYINDSKATNLHAMESALRSLDRPAVLIAGGKDKGLDYGGVLPLLKQHVSAVVLIGEIRESLAALFSDEVDVHQAETLEEAVGAAQGLAVRGGTVLFSPGTSSFDMFSGYEARGDVFRAAVNALK